MIFKLIFNKNQTLKEKLKIKTLNLIIVSRKELLNFLNTYSNWQLADKKSEQDNIIIILAGGHGKRIRSSTPKVVFELWGIPSVVRVSQACRSGLKTKDEIIVVGKQAQSVTTLIGKESGRGFVYQEVQNGTGDAVKLAIDVIPSTFRGNIFIFPGDAGLLNASILREFKAAFQKTQAGMMMLTGNYAGEVDKNYYGRVVRKNNHDKNGQVLAIVQYQDIIKMKKDESLTLEHEGTSYSFTKHELYHIREYDAMMFAFRYQDLKKYIGSLSKNNVQQEYYLTDLVRIFQSEEAGS